MRYLHLNPPIHDLLRMGGFHYKFNQSLGGPILVALARAAGWEAEYLDAEAVAWGQAQLRAYLRQTCPDVVGMTVLSLGVRSVKRAVDVIRRELPGAYIVLGGPHATAMPEETLDLGADCVVVGQATGNFVHILAERLRGIVQGVAVHVDDWPVPAWEHCRPPLISYTGNDPVYARPEGMTLWNLNCPHRCVFCSLPIYQGQPMQFRSPERICDELARLRDGFGVRGLFVYSDELLGATAEQARWLIGVCEEIVRRGLNTLTIKTQGRCSRRFITRELLEAMKAAGFRAVMWGCESGSQKVLDAYEKHLSVEDIWYTLRLAREVGLDSWTFWMVGGIEEAEEETKKTEELILDLKAAGLLQYKQVSVMTPVPGARLWDLALKNGWFASNPAERSRRYQFTPELEMPWMSRQRIACWRDRLAAI